MRNVQFRKHRAVYHVWYAIEKLEMCVLQYINEEFILLFENFNICNFNNT